MATFERQFNTWHRSFCLHLQHIVRNSETTVVAHYESQPVVRETSYQGEEELEQELIEQLERQGYEYVSIKEENALTANPRAQLEKLNHFTFTDNEWERFFKTE